ncbi:MAG: hypothetical protein LBS77_00785 [Desulfovibrio sp.]|jgi:hypothetical protein|nr:hypothetical protein [Desulfovibrio sp.]
MKTIQDFFAQWPLLWTLVETACMLIPLGALLAYSGVCFVSALAKILSQTRGRTSFDKCARQLASLGLVLGWILLVSARIWLFLTRAETGTTISVWLMEICWFLLAASVLAASLYHALWKWKQTHPAVFIFFGLSSGLLACAGLLGTLMTARIGVLGLPPGVSTRSLEETPALFLKLFAVAEWNSPFWNMLYYTPALILVFSAGTGALWILARRRYDDFGRDHYNSMIAWCSGLARNAWGLLWILLLVFNIFQLQLALRAAGDDILMELTELATVAAYLLFWSTPALLWAFVKRNAVPIRHKFVLLAALLLAGTFLLPYCLEICAV